MRSQSRKTSIEIIRSPEGNLPGFLALAQRHLEKSRPAPSKKLGSYLITFQVPLDLMSMVLPASVVRDIDSVELNYHARGKLLNANGDPLEI